MKVTARSFAPFVVAAGMLLVASVAAQASALRVGEADGGSIVWDGDSEVRTMNIFGGALTSLAFGDPIDLFVQMTVENDLDGIVNVSPLRLILSGNVAEFSTLPPGWVSLEDARAAPPALRNYEQPGDVTRRVVAFFADFQLISPGLFGLSALDQARLNQVLADFPNHKFVVGLGSRLGTSLSSGDPSNPARATFTVVTSPQPIPEPSTLVLLGAAMLSSRFLRRQRGRT